jgi:hypothetical protein
MRVVRPKWTPRTEEQRRAIAAAKRAAKRADEAEGLMWDAVGTALDCDVPAAYMADVVGRSRTSLYRHIPRPTSTGTETD